METATATNTPPASWPGATEGEAASSDDSAYSSETPYFLHGLGGETKDKEVATIKGEKGVMSLPPEIRETYAFSWSLSLLASNH